MKILALIVGAAILFTTAHVSILATGGYGSSHAFIALGVAAGVAVASIVVGRAWDERAEDPCSRSWSSASLPARSLPYQHGRTPDCRA